jgi:hypothetical protein
VPSVKVLPPRLHFFDRKRRSPKRHCSAAESRAQVDELGLRADRGHPVIPVAGEGAFDLKRPFVIQLGPPEESRRSTLPRERGHHCAAQLLTNIVDQSS